MGQKFANIQFTFDFLSTLLNLNGEQTKINMGMDIMLIRGIVLKVINNEKTIITHQEIIDPIA